MANNKIQLKRSLTSGNVPNATLVSQGELAINIPDRRLFTKDETNAVIDVFGQSVNTTANVQFKNGTFTGTVSISGVVSSSSNVSGTQIISTIAQGIPPLQVTSTTVVANLNADLLDGQHGTYYSNLQNSTNILNLDRGGTNSNLSAVAGGIAYSNSQGITLLAAGIAGQFLISNNSSAPVWTDPGSLAVGYAWTVNNGVYTTGSYSNPTWIVSLDKAKVGLGNVTNESKETMFNNPTFTGTTTANNDVLIKGNLTVQGTQFISSSNSTGYSTNFLQLHTPAAGWITNNDGKDIGIVYEHYNPNPVYAVITGGSANGSVATLQVPRGGAYLPGAFVTVSNVVPAEFNGTFKILSTTSNTFSYALLSSNTINTTGTLGRSTRLTELAITSGTTDTGSKISTINYTTPVLALNVGDTVTIAGAIPIGYNGTWTVLTATTGSFTFQNTTNQTAITTGGIAVLSNRHAFSGWTNDENAFEFYKVGAGNPNGTFNGIYGEVKGSRFHAAPPPGVTATELQEGLSFHTGDSNDSQVWDANTAASGTLGQVKVVGLGQVILDSSATGVTYTNAASLYITNAPANGHNVVITNPYALQVAAGKSLFGGNVQVYGVTTANDVTITGNLTVSGTTTYINTTQLNIGDNLIVLNADVPGATAPTEDAGIIINRGSSANVQFSWNETTDRWELSNTYSSGTLQVAGATTLSTTLAAGNTTITGFVSTTTLTSGNTVVNGTTTLNGTLAAGNTNIIGTSNVSGNSAVAGYIIPRTTAGLYGNVYVTATSDVAGNSALRIQTQSGWLDVGAKDTAYTSFVTDRPRYYFDHEVQAVTGFKTFGAGNYLYDSGFVIANGNATVGTTVISNTGTISTGNTTVTGFVNATAGVNSSVITVGTSLVANTIGVFHTGTINAASHTVGNAFTANSTGVFPGSNTVGTALGDATHQWNLVANTATFSGALTTGATLVAGNTTITGFANVSSTLSVTGTAAFGNNVSIAGDLTVTGTTTYINTSQLAIGDNLITLNADLPSGTAPTEDAGIIINRGSSANTVLKWDEIEDEWHIGGNAAVYGYLLVEGNTGFGNGVYGGTGLTVVVDSLHGRIGIQNTTPNAPLVVGPASSIFTNPVAQFAANANSWLQLNGQNLSSGNNASTDLMLAADAGTDTSNYIDVGINSSTYNQTAYGIMKPYSGYVFVNGGDLTIGTQTNHDVIIHTGNTTATSGKVWVVANGNVGIANSTPGQTLVVGGTLSVGNTTITGFANVSANVNVAGSLVVTGTINRNPIVTTTLTGDISGTASATLTDLASNTITVATTLSTTGVAAGTYGNSSYYPVVTVDSKGRVTSVVNQVTAAGDTINALNWYPANSTLNLSSSFNERYAVITEANNSTRGLVIVVDSVSNTGNVFAASANSVKTAYDAAITANTNASNAAFLTTGTLPAGRLPAFTGDVTSTVGTANLTLATTGVVAGTYGNSSTIPSITVDAKGRITGVSNSAVAGVSGYTYSAANNTFTLTTSSGSSYNATINSVQDFTVTGNLTVSGTTTYINSNQLNIGDNIIVLNADLPAITAPTENAGVTINRGSSANVDFLWDETNDRWSMGNTYIQGTLVGTSNVMINSGSLFVDTVNHRVGISNTAPTAPLTIGSGSSGFTNPIVQFAGNANSWIQLNGQNSNAGNNASSDLMLIADTGTDTTNYIDLGINSSTYNQTAYGLMKPLSGYLFVNGGNLSIGTQTNHDVIIHTGNTTSTSGKVWVVANGNVGIANGTPVDKLSVNGTTNISGNTTIGGNANVVGNATVGGTLTHGGMVLSSGTNIDQIWTVTDSIQLTTDWQNTSVNASDLPTGTYVVQVLVDDSDVGGGQSFEYYSGIMSWYSSATDTTVADEIVLHRAGKGPSSGAIFLRVQGAANTDPTALKLQIAGTTNNAAPDPYIFKFRRLI